MLIPLGKRSLSLTWFRPSILCSFHPYSSTALRLNSSVSNCHYHYYYPHHHKLCHHHHNHRFQFHQRRTISNRIYSHLTYKGLLCTAFPEQADFDRLLSHKQTIYAGFDPTAESLHLGNLLVLVALLHFIYHGHRVVVVIGDATARIGDPSGKAIERPVLAKEVVEANANNVERDVRQVVDNFTRYFAPQIKVNKDNFIICRNSTWYRETNLIDFLHTYGRHLRMGDMLNKSSVRERLSSPQGLSFSEFSYQIFQAYDWLHLFRTYGCRFQLGGIDQVVNIHNGHDLIKKVEHNNQIYGLFLPLITNEKGTKLGKSEAGSTVFLSPDITTPYNFYQYLLRRPDSEISRLLKLFTFQPDREVEQAIMQQLQHPKPWALQQRLASELTKLVHGEAGFASAKRLTEAFFRKDLTLLGSLKQSELYTLFEGATKYELEFVPGQTTVLDLALRTNCFDSTLLAVNTIKEGGFYLNYIKICDPYQVLSEEFILPNNATIVAVGKRDYRLVKWL